MILQFFSNLNDSMVLHVLPQHPKQVGAQEFQQSCGQNLVCSTYAYNSPMGNPVLRLSNRASHHQEGDSTIHGQVLSEAIPSTAQDEISHYQRKEKYYCYKGEKISTTEFLYFFLTFISTEKVTKDNYKTFWNYFLHYELRN